ncbi:alpha/beta hydrolase [Marinobacter hydrocarbonoclasticus]|nr:alpha/beta hydrolase [Marinobacter nauticus]
MYFITNRFPKQSIRSKANRKFDFNLDNNAASNSIYFCKRVKASEYVEVGSLAFLESIKASNYRQLLIYIHGFSNMPEQVFEGAIEFQSLCNKKKKNEVLVVPVIWPCDNDIGIVKDYWDDQKSADMSAYSFARIMGKFDDWRNSEEYNPQSDPCLKRINVLAHSMGNRVYRGALTAWNKYDLPRGVPLVFRNSFLVAADIINESLERGHSGELICHASRNVVVYHASDDLALRASKAANLKNKIASRRLGHSGPEDLDKVPKNVYSVDCDDYNNQYDFPKGHSYFRSGTKAGIPGVVFEHLYHTLESGRVPGSRDEILRSPKS